ncbi:MAG: hypothetical protein A3F54_00435 [Candidatus Kerfeldbacteria bacterium RIFCSPHIGHO2_12_FULL_48_17]|uniref:Uncharacterized protein n=1 Tax=Candidatus Kerfeldbacteria bacterium RIFCSPHIGHO2_12_FULL_48_17 TaxID=1798542 RepID=A0A1G2B7P2_9BACT|nr:MAG: hypothetical protein A3F54_00435 [Candidatus Kerfeldbacteria bacterium RIFCSPHIGHO2_12_FULL_48_17]
MQIPFLTFFVIYLLGLFMFLLLALINIYHIIRFGWFSLAARFITLIFVLISIGIAAITAMFLLPIPWSDSFGLVQLVSFF